MDKNSDQDKERARRREEGQEPGPFGDYGVSGEGMRERAGRREEGQEPHLAPVDEMGSTHEVEGESLEAPDVDSPSH